MRLNYKLVLFGVICLSFKACMTGCEVVWVNRNVTDSFRVGKDGCRNDTSVCPSRAKCRPDGSCLCNVYNPNFRNPVLEWFEDGIKDGDSYGCVDNIVGYRVIGKCYITYAVSCFTDQRSNKGQFLKS